jgi:hypothetical protein
MYHNDVYFWFIGFNVAAYLFYCIAIRVNFRTYVEYKYVVYTKNYPL